MVPVVYPGKALGLPEQITAVVLMHGGVSLGAERYQGATMSRIRQPGLTIQGGWAAEATDKSCLGGEYKNVSRAWFSISGM